MGPTPDECRLTVPTPLRSVAALVVNSPILLPHKALAVSPGQAAHDALRPPTRGLCVPWACRIPAWLLVGLLALAGAAFPASAADVPPSGRAVVSALGHLRPEGGVIHVAAPYTLQGPPLLGELLVREGISVTNGQVLARTHVHAAARAAWKESLREVDAARARRTQAEAGAKPAELAALDAEARRIEAEFSDAARESERFRRLRTQDAVSAQELDLVETRMLSSSNALSAARLRRMAGTEVRPVDVEVARRDLEVAEAHADRMQAEWRQTEIRAPRDGVVLKVHAREGELVGPAGLLDLGHVGTMEVLAEVYESDVRRVQPGQRAEVRGEAFAGTLTGRVESVGWQVRPNRLLQPDPAAFTDARVVEVVVRLADAQPASRLSGALVDVRILP